MCTESELKEYEKIEINNGSRMIKFHGKHRNELEKKLWNFVNENNIDIKFLVCRKFRYNLYY